MAHEKFKAKLAALDALRSDGSPRALEVLRKALLDRNAFVIARAATIVADDMLFDLLPATVAAFKHVLGVAIDDPGCLAKIAVAKALKELGHRDAAEFLVGLEFVQMEPVWGGKVDTAGPLRGTCATALVACDLDPAAMLTALTDHFVDPDKWVRIDVARAIAQLDRPESVVLLRLKALCGDAEAEVLGQCFASLLEIAPNDSVAFVARFLGSHGDDVSFEAVNALAQSRSADAFGHIAHFWQSNCSPDLRLATVGALAASPDPRSAEFLLEIVRERAADLASAAVAALGSSRFRNDVRERLSEAVDERDDARTAAAFRAHFNDER